MDPFAIPTRSADETTVCQILLDLKTTIVSLSEILSAFNWCRRRRRSCLEPPPAPFASLHKSDAGPQLCTPHIKAEDDAAAAVRTTASPDTPLSFSPSESDDKSKRPSSKKTSKKRSREELIDMIQELTQQNDLLVGEVGTVRKYYHKLKTYNSELKSIKQEVVNTSPKKEASQNAVNSCTDSSHYYRPNSLSNQPPLIGDPTVERFRFPFGPIQAQKHGIDSVNGVGPVGIDLNVPAEEALAFQVEPCRPLDVSRALADRRAKFAEARRRRRGLIRIKAMRSACGIRLPTPR